MLNPRIYRAALLPILFALVLLAFSVRDPPRALTTTLAPDAFDGATAFRDLAQLSAAAPARRPGSRGDALVAGRVEAVLRASGFRVHLRTSSGQTADGSRELATVLGERAGFSNHRIVVLAHRDALGDGAAAELSGTAALLELARVLGGRTLHRTLVLVSTSGGSAGAVAAQALAQQPGGPVDAVLVLGDLASPAARQPLVVPWSGASDVAPLALRRTVEAAVVRETGEHPAGASLPAQLARLAVPLTLSEQGPFEAEGIPAVLLSASGERPPAADAPVSAARLTAFGRAALRSVAALDGGAELAAPSSYMTLQRKLLPAWPVRLLAATLLLPVLLAAIDALARVRRRRERVAAGFAWLAAVCAPFALVVLAAVGLFRVGLIGAAPPAPVPQGAIAVGGAVLVVLLVVLGLGWLGLRPLVQRALGVADERPGAGAAVAVLLVLCAAAFAVWIANPFACLLLVPALHLWLIAVSPDVGGGRGAALLLLVGGLLAPLLLAFTYMRELGLDPLELAWMGTLLVAGGGIGIGWALLWSIVLGCAAAVLLLVLRAGAADRDADAPISVRGPSTYAGPGSLGGTESALRR